jgi:hypothetical protein
MAQFRPNSFAGIRVPPGARIIHESENVVILPAYAGSFDGALRRKPGLHACISHDRGTTWPDPMGCALAQESLDAGGAVILQFECISDAYACLRRLEAGAEARRQKGAGR